MSQDYACPRCAGEIRYRTDVWAPWRTNEPFRCPHCAALLQRIHSGRSALLKFGVFIVFLTSIAAAFWVELRPVWRGFGMSLPELAGVAFRLVAILLAYLVVMRLVTRHRLVARREDDSR